MLYQGIVVAGLCFIILVFLLQHHSPGRLGGFGFATPVVGVLLSAALLDEAISPYLLASMGLVAVGIVVANWVERRVGQPYKSTGIRICSSQSTCICTRALHERRAASSTLLICTSGRRSRALTWSARGTTRIQSGLPNYLNNSNRPKKGLYQLEPGRRAAVEQELPERCRRAVRFMLSVEISTIYKKGDKTRKIHHVVILPNLESVSPTQSPPRCHW